MYFIFALVITLKIFNFINPLKNQIQELSYVNLKNTKVSGSLKQKTVALKQYNDFDDTLLADFNPIGFGQQ